MGEIVTSRFGPASLAELARVLDRDADPLAPATVVCSGPMVAAGTRRAMAARSGGLAGVDFVTPDHLIEDLARDRLAALGQHPASGLELQVALRAELAEEPGRFAGVAGHRTTEERLRRLDRDLTGLPRTTYRRLQQAGGLAGDALRALDGAARRLAAETIDPACVASEVVQVALEALDELAPWARGRLVVFAPEPLLPYEGRLLLALARRDDCTVILGLTGHPEVDRRHLGRLAGWGLAVPPLPAPPPEASPVGVRVLEVSDPEDEVRSAVRELTAHAATGTPLSRMALLYTSAEPYASLVAEHLEACGLAYSAPGHRPLSRSLAGRTLSRLLGLAEAGIERSAFFTLVASAPFRLPDGHPVPGGEWDRLSRQAGVVDAGDWEPRLSRLAARLADDADRQAAGSMLAFVTDLARRLDPVDPPSSWQGWGRWAHALLRSSAVVDPTTWPEAEQSALERVDLLLERLGVLDRAPGPDAGSGPAVTFEVFVATVRAELAAQTVPGRPGGHGLVVAPLGAVVGLGFERVAVVGVVDGLFPRSARDDSLLPDQVRVLAGGLLPPRSEAGRIDVRALAAVAAAADDGALVTTPRGDLRSRRGGVWPRVLDALVVERRAVASHHRGIVGHGRPASMVDVELRSLVSHVEGGDPIDTHPLALTDPVLAAGLSRERERGRRELTAHTGRVRAGLVDPMERVLSPTALESYAACPRRYLFGRVLRLGEDERPERVVEITARDRGTLLHLVLERFIGSATAHATPAGPGPRTPGPGERWHPQDVDRLLDLLDVTIEESAAMGTTGGRVQTEILRRQLRNELLSFITTDNDLRATRRSRPHTVELAFGFDPEPPAVLTLGDGRSLRLRGVVDRVDLTDDGGVLVIDYKGGSDRPYAGLEADPLGRGRRLQLPLYARIVAERLGRPGPRTALYWLTKSARLKPVELDEILDEQLDLHVRAVLDGIAGGLFPGVPGGTLGWPRLTFENCQFCDFDRVCPTDRQREWEAVAGDPGLTPVDILLGRSS